MQYQVKQQFGQGTERQIAEFDKIEDAKKFIFEKLAADALYKVNAIYRICHYDEVFEEWTPDKWQKKVAAEQGSRSDDISSGGGTQGKSSGFRPSPLQSSPRPAGLPPSSFREDEDKGKK